MGNICYRCNCERKQVEVPQIDDFFIRQTFSYIKDHNAWIKNSQIIDFNGKILVFKFKGNFIISIII
ncbi:hypothetical protein QW060_19565 [Myroides ceti]|uniref:THAP-type domain-containing protein n=1 Tax=Paenimyroides ceti TaxID=395087 RepID=A0ABT8D195_9FLAO|nr:hypothetical protein [Paenimyroides ceti]MDN3709225.1 hypothetical protein [Paenimyroides ceti]